MNKQRLQVTLAKTSQATVCLVQTRESRGHTNAFEVVALVIVLETEQGVARSIIWQGLTGRICVIVAS